MIALDTSFILAAEGRDGAEHWARAVDILGCLSASDLIVPMQVLSETMEVLRTLHAMPADQAAAVARRWMTASTRGEMTAASIRFAQDLSDTKSLPFEDALVVTAAAEAGAALLLSADIPEGFSYRGLTSVNPFATTPHAKLAAVLDCC